MDIRELVEKASLLDYVNQYIEMNQDGDEWFGVCPFHGDTDPSFSISESNPYVYYCFGCGVSGNILHFIQKYHKVGFPKAVELLKEFVGYVGEVTNSGASDVMKVFRQFKPRTEKEVVPHSIMDAGVMRRYDDDAVELLDWADEGISWESMRHYQVRYDARTQRIVFPIRDVNGNIISISGRTTDPDWKSKGLRKYTYTTKIHQLDTLYGLYESRDKIKERGVVYVVEGAKSVMKLRSYGYENGVALLTNHLSDYQLKLLIQLGCDVVFALDKGVDVRQDKNISKLKQFCRVYAVSDKGSLLDMKDAPVDKGKEVWEQLLKNKTLLR